MTAGVQCLVANLRVPGGSKTLTARRLHYSKGNNDSPRAGPRASVS